MKLFEFDHDGRKIELLDEDDLREEIAKSVGQEFHRIELLEFVLKLPAGHLFTLQSPDGPRLEVKVSEVKVLDL